MRVRVREVFLKKTLVIFVIVNAMLLLWASGVILYLFLNYEVTDSALLFIREDIGFETVPALTMVIASFAVGLAGLVGVLGGFFRFPLIFNSYRSFLAASLCLKIFTILWSSLMHPTPVFPDHLRQFELDALHYDRRSQFPSMWSKRHVFWDKMQIQLKCCGVHDFQDWLHSACKSIPLSCCLPSQSQDCAAVLNQKVDNVTVEFLQTVKPFIFSTDCVTALRREINKIQTALVVISMIVLIVELLLYTVCNHLLKLIEHHLKKVRRDENDFDNTKFGIWLLDPSQTFLFGGTTRISGGERDSVLPMPRDDGQRPHSSKYGTGQLRKSSSALEVFKNLLATGRSTSDGSGGKRIKKAMSDAVMK